jgi:hypothetical protein
MIRFLLLVFFILVQFLQCFTAQSIEKSVISFANHSVLSSASGEWYKIAVKEDGFYKISYSDLKSYGVSTSDIQFSNIHIYGNASGRLSEQNNFPYIDDLVKNSIQFFGSEDGSFDEGDYVLFYGFGPNRLDFQNGEFHRDLHIYSDASYYFLHITSAEQPLLISNYSTQNSKNQSSTSFDYYTIHEKEDTSLVHGGQRWYGEIFDNTLTYTIPFQFPTVPVAPLKVRLELASNAGQIGNFLLVSNQGSLITQLPINTTSTDFVRTVSSFTSSINSNLLELKLDMQRINPAVKTFLDKIEIQTRCINQYAGFQYRFRDSKTVQKNSKSEFTILTDQAIQVWDVTSKTNPKQLTLTQQSGSVSFIYPTDSLIEFAVTSASNYYSPHFVSKIANQDLHSITQADLLIVTPVDFIVQANRLATIHQKLGEKVVVARLDQIYNEFSSGSVDPTAIKLFAKMVYERNKTNPSKSLKNLLLFGDGTFDPKNRVANNNYWVPTYQFLSSEDNINAMVSDDYFGILEDNCSIISIKDSMSIGVGRMLVSTPTMGDQLIDKIEQYLRKGMSSDSIYCCGNSSSSSFGDWRNNYVQIADDEENGYFVLSDTEPQWVSNQVRHPEFNDFKIYCDAYKQVVQAGGERYPDVNDAITSKIAEGALLVNYVGHGGEVGAAEERIITIPQINSWTNFSKLPLFVSSTCEFTKYDDPSRVCAGEWMSLNPQGGAIALMTTTRPVFFNINTATGSNFYANVFERDSEFKPLTFGEILRRTKNMSDPGVNKHSFTLIGDPALRIAIPHYRIVLDTINGYALGSYMDTIKALSKTRLKGHIENFNGQGVFMNGVVSVKVFDKPKNMQTLGQDTKSPVIQFVNQDNVLFKGRSEIKNGKFELNFITPKDIDYAFGAGKISLYANDSLEDGMGYESRFQVGGLSNVIIKDSLGPSISMYLNDKQFIEKGLTNNSPKLIVELVDESGVNIVGNGIGHDAVAVLDNDVSHPIVLNNFYVSNLNSYTSGRIIYDFKNLADGEHLLKVKVWDVLNNPSEKTLRFTVKSSTKENLLHVLNYPNPFTSSTHFYFEHNQVCNQLEAMIHIYTISGKLIKTIHENVTQSGFRSEGIFWDGKDDFGDKLAKGVYVYKLEVINSQGEKAEKIEKLVIL